MRVLYASGRPPYPFFLGGAARCAHRILQALAKDLAVRCCAVGSASYGVTPWAFPSPSEYAALGIHEGDREQLRLECGYPVRLLRQFDDQLPDVIDQFRPHVIWTQLDGALRVLDVASSKGVPSVYYVHDAEFEPSELRKIASLGPRMCCSSRFLADKVSRVTRGEAQVVYPAPQLLFGTQADRAGHITMVNPHRVKGLDTFLEVARRLPNERFLLVESWQLGTDAARALQERLQPLPNVTFISRVPDMRTVYGKTKLLLVPSVWEEGFGMVALEAQSCGIPVIASRRGGLPEAVGAGGLLVTDYQNVDSWLSAIDEVFRRYDDFAQRAVGHAASERFTPSWAARRFLEVCTSKPRRFPRLKAMLRGFAP